MTVPIITLNDGRAIPQIGLGVWKIEQEDTEGVVLEAFEAGYRHIDTAKLYHNEKGVGSAVRHSGLPREEIFVTTKLWNTEHVEGRAWEGFEESMDKLGLDYVDLYLIHWPRPDADRYVDAWRTLQEIHATGRAKSIGVANFTPEQLQRLIDETGVVPVCDQVELHPGLAQRELREFAAAHGIAVVSWGPLGQGKYPLFDYPQVAAAAAAHGVTPAQVVLRWHLQNGLIPIPKSSNPARLRENLAAADFELTADELAAIDAIDAGLRQGGDPMTVTA